MNLPKDLYLVSGGARVLAPGPDDSVLQFLMALPCAVGVCQTPLRSLASLLSSRLGRVSVGPSSLPLAVLTPHHCYHQAGCGPLSSFLLPAIRAASACC